MTVEDLQIELTAETGAADRLTKALKEVSAVADRLASQIDEVGSSTKQAEGLVDQYGNAISSATQDQQQASQAAERMSQSMDEAASSASRMGSRLGSSGKQGRKFNQILFSSGDLVQDLQFGMRGAGNNIAFMAEQMAEVKRPGDSMLDVFQGLKSSLFGVGGIILGVQALIVAGPKIVSMFQQMGSEAGRLQEHLKGVAENIEEMLQIADNPAVERLQDLGFEDVGAAEEGLQRTRNLLQEVRRLRERTGGGDALLPSLDQFPALQRELRRTGQVVGTYSDLVEATGLRLQTLRSAEEDIQSAIKNRRQEIEAANAARRIASGLRESEISDAPAVENAYRQQTDALSEFQRRAERVIQSQHALRAQRQEPLRMGPPEREMPEFTDPFREFDTGELRGLMGTKALRTPRQVERAISALQDRLNNVPFGDQETRSEIQGLIQDLQRLGEQSVSVSQQLDQILQSGAIRSVSALSDGIADIVNPMVEVENAAQRMQRAFSRAISQMISDALRLLAIRAFTSIAGGPAGAAVSTTAGLGMASVEQPGGVSPGRVSAPTSGQPSMSVNVGVEDAIIEGQQIRLVLEETNRRRSRGGSS